MKHFFAIYVALTFILYGLMSCAREKPGSTSEGNKADRQKSEHASVSTVSDEKKTDHEHDHDHEPHHDQEHHGDKMKQKSMGVKVDPPKVEDVGDPTELAVIKSTKGTMVVEFFPDLAPLHVANFKNLAKAGFYTGTTFHRVLPGFVMQGGDPNTLDDNPNNDGQGGPGYGVKAEFNATPHVKGILSAARGSDPNSAGSQFFICLGRAAHLDNKYTVFGKVIKGMDIVEKIGSIRRDPSNKYDRNLPAVRMESVTVINRSELDKVK